MFEGNPLIDASKAAIAKSEILRRIALAREEYPGEEVGKPNILKFISELDVLLEPARRPFRNLEVPKTANPQSIMVLPGFATGPDRMEYLAEKLNEAGHSSNHWGLGRNWGVGEESLDQLELRLIEIAEQNPQRIALVGWSLGGLFGRELAKRRPEMISKVITMGSPFSGSPRANNVWRAYQAITGYRVDQPPIEADLSIKPPVETIALWSDNDGMIAPECASGLEIERDRAVALSCTHAGFTYSDEAVLAILAELDRS